MFSEYNFSYLFFALSIVATVCSQIISPISPNASFPHITPTPIVPDYIIYCTSQVNCPVNYYCINNRCINRCANVVCIPTLKCVNGLCVNKCLGILCQIGYNCQLGVCVRYQCDYLQKYQCIAPRPTNIDCPLI